MVNGAVGGRLTWLMGAGGIKPLKADIVGEAIVEALEDADVRIRKVNEYRDGGG